MWIFSFKKRFDVERNVAPCWSVHVLGLRSHAFLFSDLLSFPITAAVAIIQRAFGFLCTAWLVCPVCCLSCRPREPFREEPQLSSLTSRRIQMPSIRWVEVRLCIMYIKRWSDFYNFSSVLLFPWENANVILFIFTSISLSPRLRKLGSFFPLPSLLLWYFSRARQAQTCCSFSSRSFSCKRRTDEIKELLYDHMKGVVAVHSRASASVQTHSAAQITV